METYFLTNWMENYSQPNFLKNYSQLKLVENYSQPNFLANYSTVRGELITIKSMWYIVWGTFSSTFFWYLSIHKHVKKKKKKLTWVGRILVFFQSDISNSANTIVHFEERWYFMFTDAGKVKQNLCDTTGRSNFHIVKFNKRFTRKLNWSV